MMLNIETFKSAYAVLANSKNIPINKYALKITYELYKNDFTDEQFNNAVALIIKKETLYNNIDPAIFNKYIPKDLEKNDFTIKCLEYLQQDFIPSYYKEYFNEGLTIREEKALKLVGGISHCWACCHNQYGDYLADKAEFKIKEIKQAYDNYEYVEAPLKIENIKDNKVKDAIQTLTKKLTSNI